MPGSKLSSSGLLAAFALAVGQVGCGGGGAPGPSHTGGRQEPSNQAEQQILDRLDNWTGDQTIGGVAVHAEPVYFAASGATCRWLVLESASGPTQRRLACKNAPAAPAPEDGQGAWYYAPDVLVAPASMP